MLKNATSVIVTASFLCSMLFPRVVKTEIDGPENGEKPSIIEIIDITAEQKEPDVKEWVLAKVAEAGLNPREAEIIVNCESHWDPDAIGINKNRTADLGLWQINTIHKDISNADKLDYKKATEWAIQKRVKDGNWRAWYCAKRLAYLK